jgi:hypothetical protein
MSSFHSTLVIATRKVVSLTVRLMPDTAEIEGSSAKERGR